MGATLIYNTLLTQEGCRIYRLGLDALVWSMRSPYFRMDKECILPPSLFHKFRYKHSPLWSWLQGMRATLKYNTLLRQYYTGKLM
jgi:hypothetical protein